MDAYGDDSDDGPLPPTPPHAVKSPREKVVDIDNVNNETNQHLVAREQLSSQGRGNLNLKTRLSQMKVESLNDDGTVFKSPALAYK